MIVERPSVWVLCVQILVFADTEEQETLKLKLAEFKERKQGQEDRRLAEVKRKAEAKCSHDQRLFRTLGATGVITVAG